MRASGDIRFAAAALLAVCAVSAIPPNKPADVLGEIDKAVRENFWDPELKGVDWTAAVRSASEELSRAKDAGARDRAYDRLLGRLEDSHTFRVPGGTMPERNWATCGLRIGRETDGYAVKAVLPGSSAERAGLKLGDRVLSIAGRKYGPEKINFRDLFLVFEGFAGSAVEVAWTPEGDNSQPRTSRLVKTPEEPGDTLVWKSARVIRKQGRAFGYARLWGLNAETALAVVDLLLDREEVARVKPELSGWGGIEGFLLDARANSGGYDPNILATFLRGRWSSGDYFRRTREGRRLVPPEYKPLPVALLTNSATASAAEALALQVRRHGIGPIVGEPTAGMATGGAFSQKLSDGSSLWIATSQIEDENGRPYEGRGVPPDVLVPDRPPRSAGEEEMVIEAAIRVLIDGKSSPRK